MDSPYGHADCKQELHLGLCPGCQVPASPKGTRIVAQIMVDEAGGIYRDSEVLRVRLQCRNPACPQGSWTVYEPGGYPCRRYALAVVVSGVGELAVVLQKGTAALRTALEAPFWVKGPGQGVVRRWVSSPNALAEALAIPDEEDRPKAHCAIM